MMTLKENIRAILECLFSNCKDELINSAVDSIYSLLISRTEDDYISRKTVIKYIESWKNMYKYYHPYAKNFDIPYDEAIKGVQSIPAVPHVKDSEGKYYENNKET